MFYGLPEETPTFLKQTPSDFPVFGPLSLLYDDSLIKTLKTSGKEILAVSPGFLVSDRGKAFQHLFKDRYGFLPGAVAANAYEGMKMMIDAVMQNGSGRDSIREFLLNIRDYPGINGTINFDDNGNLESWKGILKIFPK